MKRGLKEDEAVAQGYYPTVRQEKIKPGQTRAYKDFQGGEVVYVVLHYPYMEEVDHRENVAVALIVKSRQLPEEGTIVHYNMGAVLFVRSKEVEP